MEDTTKWGGQRDGAGRKKIAPRYRKKSRCFWVTETEYKKLHAALDKMREKKQKKQ